MTIVMCGRGTLACAGVLLSEYKHRQECPVPHEFGATTSRLFFCSVHNNKMLVRLALLLLCFRPYGGTQTMGFCRRCGMLALLALFAGCSNGSLDRKTAAKAINARFN